MSKGFTKRKHSKEAKMKMSLAHIGMKHNKEAKVKMSIAQKKRTHLKECKCSICSWNGCTPFIKKHTLNNGIKFTQEHIKNLKISHKNQKPWNAGKKRSTPWMLKEKNPNWMGGKSFEEYSEEFNTSLKKLIRQRDNYKCQLCGCPEIENGRKLNIHHIDYNKKNNNSTNLISLCNSCHSKTNNNRNHWMYYFKKVLEV